MGDGQGFVYRFPGGDFELGVGPRMPEVGDTLRRRGRTWSVVDVRTASDKRLIVNLESLDEASEEAQGLSQPGVESVVS